MPVFQVFLNGKKVSTAGVGDLGVLGARVSWVRRKRERSQAKRADKAKEELTLHVGGLIAPAGEHVRWLDRKLKVGDEIQIAIVENAAIDRPRSRQRRDRRTELRAKKRYVKEMAKGFGWKIQTRRG